MGNKQLKKINKYEKIASKFKINAKRSPEDRKRHDRISKREAKAMSHAYEDDLTITKIAQLFDRDARVVAEKVKDAEKVEPILTMLEVGRRVIDSKTDRYARLIKFRLGNVSDKLIIIDNVCLKVIESEIQDFGPQIEGFMNHYNYDVELHLGEPGEYKITDDKFKLSKNDADDFEILCTAAPGLVCIARIKIYYSNYPESKTFDKYSEDFYLTFPKSRKPST